VAIYWIPLYYLANIYVCSYCLAGDTGAKATTEVGDFKPAIGLLESPDKWVGKTLPNVTRGPAGSYQAAVSRITVSVAGFFIYISDAVTIFDM
jgi:hypothetical protein